MRIFVTYARGNRAAVEALAGDLKGLGHEVWYDRDLGGGQAWWEEILRQITQCDLYVFALSQHALESDACTAELDYAQAVRRSLLVVRLLPAALMPSALEDAQFIDYTAADDTSLFKLRAALERVPAPTPLPDPLPAPPALPKPKLHDDKHQIDSSAELSPKDELGPVGRRRGVFLSYRREDAAGWAGRLYEYLARVWEPNQVFMDAETTALAHGEDFRDAIPRTIRASDAVLVVIGPDWVNVRDEAGNRRIDNEADHVRVEVATALAADVRVVPVLVGGAWMPNPADLPEPLKHLAYRNAARVDDVRFRDDARSLAESLKRYVDELDAERAAPLTGPVLAAGRAAEDAASGAEPEETEWPTAAEPWSWEQREFSSDVQVTVYRPNIAVARVWEPLPVFIHHAYAIGEVRSRARALLGRDEERYDAVHQDTRRDIRHGSELTVESWIRGGECSPQQIRLRWAPPLQEATFQFRYLGPESVARGGVRVFANGVAIAECSLTIAIATHPQESRPRLEEATVVRHRKVFASYSHKDKPIVRLVASAARALGDDFMIDAEALRSGERWAERLDDMIRESDAFQLFWSRHSMRSPHVRHEWELALSLQRDNFIKPVYWKDPRPEKPPNLPPPELDALHFSKLDVKPNRFRSLLPWVRNA